MPAAADPISLSSLGPAVAGVSLGVLAVLAVIGLFVVVVVASRSDVDASGRRPYSVYLFGISFVTVFATLIASFVIIDGLVQLIGEHPQPTAVLSLHPVGDAVARQVVLGGLVVVVAGLVLWFHLRAGMRMAGGAPTPDTPAGRVSATYLCAVAFVSVVIVVISTVVGVYFICQLIAPGVFRSSGGRIPTTRNLIAVAYLALASAALLFFHLRRAPGNLRRVLMPGRSVRTVAPSPPPPPPPATPQTS